MNKIPPETDDYIFKNSVIDVCGIDSQQEKCFQTREWVQSIPPVRQVIFGKSFTTAVAL